MSSRALRAYLELILSRPKATLVLILGATLFLAAQIGSLKIDMDPDLWAPQSHPYIIATHTIERIFGGRNISMVGVVAKHGTIYQQPILEKIAAIQNGLEQIPGVVRRNVLSIAARKIKGIRGVTDGLEVKQVMEGRPSTPEEISAVQAAVEGNPIYRNALVSEDQKAATIIADFNIDQKKPSYSKLAAAINRVIDPQRDDQVDIYQAGVPVTVGWFEHQMMQMPLFFGVALVIIMAIHYWSFKSLQGVFLPIVTSLLSVVWGLGLMGILGIHMDGMNTTTPILIMAVGAGHAVQILKRYYEEYHRMLRANRSAAPSRELSRAAIIEALLRVGPAMITAGLIGAITFFSLSTASISVVRNFGLFAGFGILAALILEMSLIPVIRSLLPPPLAKDTAREQRPGFLDHLLELLARALISGSAPKLLVGGLVLVAIALAGAWRLKADNSMINYNSESSQVRKDNASLNHYMGGTSSIFFLVEGKTQDRMKDPAVLQGMSKLQSFLDQQPYVGKTQSIADHLKQINQAMHGNDPTYHSIPDNPALVAQYLLLYSMSGDPQDFDSFVDNDYQRAVVWVYLKSDSTANAEAIAASAQRTIQANFPNDVTVQIGGSLPQTIAINADLTRGKFKNMLQMAVVVFILSSLVLRSLIGGLFVVTPLVAIMLANLGLMGWLGVPLDMGTAATAAMAIGIGADYELYLLFRFREELARTGDLSAATRTSLLTSGKAIIVVALAIAGGYAVLLGSSFAFYNRLALTVIATMVASALCALVFLRAMVVIFKPRFIFGEASARPAVVAEEAVAL